MKTHSLKKPVAAAAAIGTAMLMVGISAGPASAGSLTCSSWVSNKTGYATCSGSGTFRVSVQCYYWGANTSSPVTVNNSRATAQASCPSWSRVTRVIVLI